MPSALYEILFANLKFLTLKNKKLKMLCLIVTTYGIKIN